MNKLMLIVTSLSILLLTSCATTALGDNSATLSTSATANFKAEVSIGEKIEGTGSVMYLFGWLPLTMKTYAVSGVLTGSSGGGGSSMGMFPDPFSMLMSLMPPSDLAKDEAAYNAVKTSGCDVLVDPVYEMVTTNFFLFKTQTCKVTGYRGTIEGWVQL